MEKQLQIRFKVYKVLCSIYSVQDYMLYLSVLPTKWVFKLFKKKKIEHIPFIIYINVNYIT